MTAEIDILNEELDRKRRHISLLNAELTRCKDENRALLERALEDLYGANREIKIMGIMAEIRRPIERVIAVMSAALERQEEGK